MNVAFREFCSHRYRGGGAGSTAPPTHPPQLLPWAHARHLSIGPSLRALSDSYRHLSPSSLRIISNTGPEAIASSLYAFLKVSQGLPTFRWRGTPVLTQGQDGALTYRAPAHFTAMPSPPSWSHLTGKLRQIPVNNRKRSFIIQCCPSTSFPHSFIPLESHADVQRALRPQHSESFPACDCRSRRREARTARAASLHLGTWRPDAACPADPAPGAPSEFGYVF